MRSVKLLVGLLLLVVVGQAFADGGSIQVTTLPTVTVCDGRSTVTISAYVRRPSGQAVPDGTQVVFTTTLGTIKNDSVVTTVNGVARAILQTGTVAGTAQVTAQALSVGAVTTTDIEFLSDRSLLSSAREYIEVVAPGYMMFSLDQRILSAAGPNHGVKLRYREIEIEADDLQFNIPAYEVRARKAHLKMGKVSQDFDELNIKLTARKGVGTTTIIPQIPVFVTAVGRVPWVEQTHPHFGLANVGSGGVTQLTEAFDSTQFQLADLTDSVSMVSAKKAIIFPQKKIQFQRASIIMGGVTLMKMPLYEAPLNSATNVITDNMFQVQNNKLNINYPVFLSLKPGETSQFSFTMGDQYGRSSGTNNGLSLNYLLNWNRGDEREGGLALSSMTTRNWDLSAHQYIRFDDRTSATAFFDMPEGQSLYENLNFNKQFTGFGLSLNGSSSHSIAGNRFDNSQVAMTLEKDPMKVGKLPFRMTVGANAGSSATKTSLQGQSQSVVGIFDRLQLVPQNLGKTSQFNGFFTVTEQSGHNNIKGLAFQGNATLSKQFGNAASAVLSYDYLQSGFSSGLTGHHQLSLSGQIHRGNFSSNFATIKALDVDRASLFADLGYQLAHLWRLSYSYTLDRFLGTSFVDYTAAIGYRIGMREIGLTYSRQTKRFGIELLNTGLGH